MLRSLHMKLVLVLVLLIVSVMAVVGTFLFNRVSSYYFDDFTEQMNSVFTPEFFNALKNAAAGEDGAMKVKEVIEAYSSSLGIGSYRNFYILDGTGKLLYGSNDEQVERTSAIIAALNKKIGQERRISHGFLDRAAPIIENDKVKYIVYIKDTKQELQDLTTSLFSMILRAVLLGLIISVFLSFLLSKTITTPIENLTKSAKLISLGEFKSMPEVHSRDEIGVLTETFNDMAGVLRDTLETVEGERNKLNTLFLHMTDGVTAFNREGQIIHINPAAVEMLGISPEHKPCFDEIYAATGITLEKALELTEQESIEKKLSINNRTLQLFIAAFGSDEGERGAIAVIHDITEQQKLEDARREFVANVSHELRTPLTNIKSYTETLMENPDAPDELRDKFYNVIMNETDRMTRIVKDLLTLSRLDSTRMDWKISRFDIKKSIEHVFSAMEMDAKKHAHTMLLDMDEDLPEITGDRERIEQVLINILSNAVKYTPDGGKISMRVHYNEGYIHISVTDNGIGIPKSDLQRVFERFYRVDKARSREKGGTGLGLAIAREIIEYHGGNISISSVFNHGTTVKLSLAVAPDFEREPDGEAQ
jgi:two-component system sensor histidine kinase VicK